VALRGGNAQCPSKNKENDKREKEKNPLIKKEGKGGRQKRVMVSFSGHRSLDQGLKGETSPEIRCFQTGEKWGGGGGGGGGGRTVPKDDRGVQFMTRKKKKGTGGLGISH